MSGLGRGVQGSRLDLVDERLVYLEAPEFIHFEPSLDASSFTVRSHNFKKDLFLDLVDERLRSARDVVTESRAPPPAISCAP